MSILIAAVIVVIILLLAVLLIIPFRLSFGLIKEGIHFQGFYKISYLGFTLIEGEMPSSQPEKKKDLKKSEEPGRDYDKGVEKEVDRETDRKIDVKTDRGPNIMHPPAELRLAIDAFPQIAHILIDFIRSIDVKRLCCKISFGLDDPVDTAMISGYLWSIASAVGLYRADITIDPRFDREQLDVSLLTELEVRMLWLVMAAVKALQEKRIRKLIFALAKGEMA